MESHSIHTHRSYAVIGTGAIGGYYGAMLQKSGKEVHFLIRSDFEYVNEYGLVIESVKGDFTLKNVKAYSSVTDMPPCDVVLVTLKTTQNALLATALPRIVKEGSVVIVMQNGLGIEEEVAEIIGAERIMGGLCFICSMKTGPGYIRHIDYGHIILGEFTCNRSGAGITARLQQIAEDFKAADVTVNQTENLGLARWKKLVWNIPYNGLSVVLNATTEELIKDRDSRALVTTLMEEVVVGATLCGYEVGHDTVQNMLSATETMIPYHPSMKIDFDKKRPMEIASIYGNPLREVRKRGGNMPTVAMLYQELLFLNERNLNR
jgi:2-dehydropantoate 2-reductase